MKILLAVLLGLGSVVADAATPKRECWVWLIDRMTNDADWTKATNVLTRAAAVGYNALVLSAGEDIYWKPESAARLSRLDGLAKGMGVEIIPAIWSMGYGGTVSYANPDVVESTPNRGLGYVAHGKWAKFVPVEVETGLEGRVATNSLKIAARLKPFRTYLFTCRVKTEGISPVKYYSVRGNISHRPETELYDFPVAADQDWKTYAWEFNTFSNGVAEITVAVNKYLNVTGKAYFDSIRLAERPLTRCLTTEEGLKPVVRSAKTGRVYVAGKDYKPFPKMKSCKAEHSIVIELLPGGAISEGEELLVDAHVPCIQGAKQFSSCPSAAGLKDYWRMSARHIENVLHPRRWLLSVDEWRIANRCAKCRARGVSPGRLMGECISDMCRVIREVHPGAEVCAWADMFCPLENAGRNPYYLVDGSMLDSWKCVPKDLIMVPWMNGRDNVKSTTWLMDHGFRCLAGGYYNYPDLSRDVVWRDGCKANPLFLGMMFTTWGGAYADGGYDQLEAYAGMVFER